MSVTMDQGADALLQAAREGASPDEELSDVDVDGDGSSSLSDIEDKDAQQDEGQDDSDELSDVSDEENDSEAETERLEESPNKFRAQQDVVLSSNNDYERTPSKLQNQIAADDDEDDDDPLSDAESLNESPESPKSSAHDDAEQHPPTAPTSLEDESVNSKNMLSVIEADTRKRKRSIMAGSGFEEDLDEPSRKRTGSIMGTADDYAIDDDANQDEEVDISHNVSGNISVDEGGAAQEDEVGEEHAVADDEAPEAADTPLSPKKRGRGKRKGAENGVRGHGEDEDALLDGEGVNGHEETAKADEENAENEGDDEAEAAQRNEELLEQKRIALDQLGSIEIQFSTFRERLYEERLEQLNREEAMLKQDKPTHPLFLSMLACIDARRDERIRIADTLESYQKGALRKTAVARRSQIHTQFKQHVRDERESKIEQLGKQWYEVQHDRRSYAGSVPDYTLKFPTSKQQQIRNQVAYSTEVSVLSGIAKHVGFPAAPTMVSATAPELDDDLEKIGHKMGRARQPRHAPAGVPFHELAALRTVGSMSRVKPAEEQFIEQTPWANPQHPSHAHLLSRQASTQQTPRTTSPFSQAQRRHSHQPGPGVPVQGTFSNSSSLLQQSKGHSMSGGRMSPHNNPFVNSNHSNTIAPSPLGSRQPSLSPKQSRAPLPDQPHVSDGPKPNGNQRSPPMDTPLEARRGQAPIALGRV